MVKSWESDACVITPAPLPHASACCVIHAFPLPHRILELPALPPLRSPIVRLTVISRSMGDRRLRFGIPQLTMKLRLADSIVHIILIIVAITAPCADPEIFEIVALKQIPLLGLIFVWSGGDVGYEHWSLSEDFLRSSTVRPSYQGLRAESVVDANLGAAEASSCHSIPIPNYDFLAMIRVSMRSATYGCLRPAARAPHLIGRYRAHAIDFGASYSGGPVPPHPTPAHC